MTGSVRTALLGAVTFASALLASCFDQRIAVVESPRNQGAVAETRPADHRTAQKPIDESDFGPFQLKPEWNGPCARSEVVDVNLGHAPEAFVRAAHCQIAGKEPSQDLAKTWTERLKNQPKVRRIDVVFALCSEHGRKCELAYSDPWQAQPELGSPPVKKLKRDVGAVFMYFFNCPNEVNCKMGWANTHAPGMDQKHPLLGFGDESTGYYVPSQPGFWRRELLDAKYAGLDFLLLNTYGPDIENGKLAPLAKALESLDNPAQDRLLRRHLDLGAAVLFELLEAEAGPERSRKPRPS